LESLYILMIGLSFTVLLVLMYNSIRNIHISGSKAFISLIICVFICSLGALCELFSDSGQGMLFWRNIEQIGVYFLPVCSLYLAVDYGQFKSGKKYLPLFTVVPVVGIILLFTDGIHHIMRIGYTVSSNILFGHGITVQPSLVGMMFVMYNYCLGLASLIMLGVFTFKVSGIHRKQVVNIILSILMVFILALVKTIYLEPNSINVPVTVLFLPGGLLMFFSLFKHNLFRASPIARDKVFDVIEQGIVVTDGR
jgi:hypothetical protein